jgi:hypothetical protein
MTGREDDLAALHARVERVAWAKSELSPDGAGKNNLPFAGNPGLHRKNILPHQALGNTLRLSETTRADSRH